MGEAGEGGKREGGGSATATEGGGGPGEEARVEETHSQEEGAAEKRPRTEKSDTKTEAGGSGTITVIIQEGAHDQHLSDELGGGSYYGLCEGSLGVVQEG